MINMVQMKINGEIILFLNEQPNVTSDPMLTQFLRKVAWQRPAFLTKRLHRHLYLTGTTADRTLSWQNANAVDGVLHVLHTRFVPNRLIGTEDLAGG